jgi:threonine synthase
VTADFKLPPPAPTVASDRDFMHCPRCGRPGAGFAGCPSCRAEGVAVNLELSLADARGLDLTSPGGGPWVWRQTLPLAPSTPALRLGEGNTAVVEVPARGGDLLLKMESANPTGSHKDRAMSVGVAKAVELGAPVVILPSSGNAGAAAAAYAARAGVRCVVTTTSSIPAQLHAQLLAYGAAVAGFPDSNTRNQLTELAVEELGWFPLANYALPASGGNPYGNEGYKSIAYELARDLGEEVDAVVVPTCRADLLAGIERGYQELLSAGIVARIPRLVAAETSTGAPLTRAMSLTEPVEQERVLVVRGDSPAFSIGGENAIWQGLQALRRSSGTALASEPAEYMAEWEALGRMGIFLEPSSAVGVSVGRRLAAGGGRVVVIASATGLKDTARLTDGVAPVVLPLDLDALGTWRVER